MEIQELKNILTSEERSLDEKVLAAARYLKSNILTQINSSTSPTEVLEYIKQLSLVEEKINELEK